MEPIVEKVQFITFYSPLGETDFLGAVQKIKQNLVHKAQLKKELARARIQESASHTVSTQPIESQNESGPIEPHPDRQALMDAPADTTYEMDEAVQNLRRKKRPKVNPFNKETFEAQKRKEEADERHRTREQADAERKKKLQDRDRMRKAVAKARKPGINGQRRLGRESFVLLERVKKLMDNGD
jgi:hypothetical protein